MTDPIHGRNGGPRNSAMAVAASGAESAPKDATKVAQQILERASVMQSEIDRFLAIAAGRHAA